MSTCSKPCHPFPSVMLSRTQLSLSHSLGLWVNALYLFGPKVSTNFRVGVPGKNKVSKEQTGGGVGSKA